MNRKADASRTTLLATLAKGSHYRANDFARMPKKRKIQTMPQLELANLTFKPTGTTQAVTPSSDTVQLHFENQSGKLFLGDSVQWLASLEAKTVDMVFADPPYNFKKAEWDDFESHQHYVDWSKQWIEQAARALKPDGSLYVCNFSEILADIKVAAMPFFKGCRWIVWHYKNKANLANDWGRSHESILHLRKSSKPKFNVDAVRIPYGAHTLKYPSHPQAVTSQFGKDRNGNGKDHTWTPNSKGAKPKDVFDIPTTCNGMGEKTPHPTQKPEELIRKLVLASSNANDLVVDPFSGAGTTPVVCEQLNRKWMACDSCEQYNLWAIQRLNQVPRRSIEDWLSRDRQTAQRREGIR